MLSSLFVFHLISIVIELKMKNKWREESYHSGKIGFIHIYFCRWFLPNWMESDVMKKYNKRMFAWIIKIKFQPTDEPLLDTVNCATMITLTSHIHKHLPMIHKQILIWYQKAKKQIPSEELQKETWEIFHCFHFSWLENKLCMWKEHVCTKKHLKIKKYFE